MTKKRKADPRTPMVLDWDNEEWFPLKGWDGYEYSTCGRVRTKHSWYITPRYRPMNKGISYKIGTSSREIRAEILIKEKLRRKLMPSFTIEQCDEIAYLNEKANAGKKKEVKKKKAAGEGAVLLDLKFPDGMERFGEMKLDRADPKYDPFGGKRYRFFGGGER